MRVRFAVDDRALSHLRRKAFRVTSEKVLPWAQRLERHAVTCVGAFHGDDICGFVHACWAGGSHALLLDAIVDPAHQRRGIGLALLQTLTAEVGAAVCQWLHVDHEPTWRRSTESPAGTRPPTRCAALVQLTIVVDNDRAVDAVVRAMRLGALTPPWPSRVAPARQGPPRQPASRRMSYYPRPGVVV